jgi:hypothetical protein
MSAGKTYQVDQPSLLFSLWGIIPKYIRDRPSQPFQTRGQIIQIPGPYPLMRLFRRIRQIGEGLFLLARRNESRQKYMRKIVFTFASSGKM